MSIELSDSVSRLNEEIVDLWTRYGSSGEYEMQPFVPTEENISDIEKRLTQLESSLQNCCGQNPLDDITLLHIENRVEVLSFRLKDDLAFPFRYVTSLNGSINNLLFMDVREPQRRVDVLNARLEGAEEVLRETVRKTEAVGMDRREMTSEYLGSLADVLDSIGESLSESDIPDETEGIEQLKQAAEEIGEIAQSLLHRIDDMAKPRCPVKPLPYNQRLREVWGIELEELVSWYEEEVEKSQQRFRSIAAEIDPDKSPNKLLNEELPSCDQPEDMFPLMEGFVKQARAESLSYITLPEGEECEVWPVPEQLKDSYPWGGYSGPDSLLDNLKGAVFLNDYNYEAVTLGWMKMMAIHECYPGHHAHRVKTINSPLPDCFKLGHLMSRGGPLTEGIAHRSETLMQHIFSEKAFELFVAYRRMHTAVRVMAELYLHHLDRSVEEVISLYQKYLEFSHDAARGQVHFQKLWPGYMTIYYYGQKYLAELEEQLDWDEADFTELIFSIGYGGLPVLEEVIDLSEEVRQRMLWG